MLVLLAMLCAAQTGCVRRRLTIRTNPPGAQVYIDDQYIGVTPVSTAYTYYGTRKIQLIKGGFKTETVKQNFSAPWYQYPPLDFFTENVVPYEFRDERELQFTLSPEPIIPPEELIRRGDELRGNVQRGALTPVLNPSNNPTPAAPINAIPQAGRSRITVPTPRR